MYVCVCVRISSLICLFLLVKTQILLHLCSYATLRPCGRILATIALLGYTTKVFGLMFTPPVCFLCAIFKLGENACLIMLILSRALTLALAMVSFFSSVPPLKQLVAVHAQYPSLREIDGDEPHFTNERVPGHRLPLLSQEVAHLPIQSPPNSRTLRIVQLTDIHLGTVTTPDDIRQFCMEIVNDIRPDLVLLTGDMLTTPYLTVAGEALRYALEPLKQMPGHVFGCLGNHDLESEDTIRDALISSGVTLLVDEATEITLDNCDCPIQIIGFQYRKPVAANADCYRSLLERYPPSTPDTLRLVLVCCSCIWFSVLSFSFSLSLRVFFISFVSCLFAVLSFS